MNPVITHVKTRAQYELLGYALDCTYGVEGPTFALYRSPKHPDLYFVRELEDFKNEFTIDVVSNTIEQLDQSILEKPMLNEIQEQLASAGFDGAIAIATQAEVEAGAACGQLALIVEADQQ